MTESIKEDPQFKQKSLDQMKKVVEFAQNYGGGRLSERDPSEQSVPHPPPTRRKNVVGCTICDEPGTLKPPHTASVRCQSGGRNHCSCDICF